MKLVIGSDHGGFELKQKVIRYLKKKHISVKDMGSYTPDPVDYPDIAKDVAKKVANKQYKLGILVCGTGLGMAIAANKVKGIRAVTPYNAYTAKMSRAHNDANILALGGRVLGPALAYKIIDEFIKTKFEGGRHLRRVRKIG
jgi:ribose 5-phosphate isomerase B